jgi:methyl-accepting chemotaxis protein
MVMQTAATLHAELHELEVRSTNGLLYLSDLESMMRSARNISENLQRLGQSTNEAEAFIQKVTAAAQKLKEQVQKHSSQDMPEAQQK